MEQSQEVRRQIFGSNSFRHEIAIRLELDLALVAGSVGALIRSEIVPCDLPDAADALSSDGAAVLMAIGGQRRHPPSVVRSVARLIEMPLRDEIGGFSVAAGIADTFPKAPGPFGAAVGGLLRDLWAAARDLSTQGFSGVAVGALWSAARDDVLFGTIDHRASRRHRFYSSDTVVISRGRGGLDDVRPPVVGGVVFSPRSILRFGALLDAAVTDTPAALKGSRLPLKERHRDEKPT